MTVASDMQTWASDGDLDPSIAGATTYLPLSGVAVTLD
jgi:hypothetical protein